MWRRLRAKTMAPRRPAVFGFQWPLVVATALVLVGGTAFVLYALWG